MRADAEDNRRALLEAAREVYVEEGTSVAARAAGAGLRARRAEVSIQN